MEFTGSEDFYRFIEELRDNKQYEPTEAEKEALNNLKA